MPVFSYIIPFCQLCKMDLKIATFSVNSMSEQAKRIAVISFLETVKADVILEQETHSRPYQEKAWQKEWKRGQALFHSNIENENTAGVAFLVNSPRVYIEKMNSDLQGRILTIKVLLFELQYQIVNRNAPAGTDKRAQNEIFFDNLYRHIDSTLPVVIGGDFNRIENPNLDKYPPFSLTLNQTFCSTLKTTSTL